MYMYLYDYICEYVPRVLFITCNFCLHLLSIKKSSRLHLAINKYSQINVWMWMLTFFDFDDNVNSKTYEKYC